MICTNCIWKWQSRHVLRKHDLSILKRNKKCWDNNAVFWSREYCLKSRIAVNNVTVIACEQRDTSTCWLLVLENTMQLGAVVQLRECSLMGYCEQHWRGAAWGQEELCCGSLPLDFINASFIWILFLKVRMKNKKRDFFFSFFLILHCGEFNLNTDNLNSSVHRWHKYSFLFSFA